MFLVAPGVWLVIGIFKRFFLCFFPQFIYSNLILFRYSDFLVNEITIDGSVVSLSSLTVVKSSASNNAQVSNNGNTPKLELDSLVRECIDKLISDDQSSSILFEHASLSDKVIRTGVHHLVKSIRSDLWTDTKVDRGKYSIGIHKSTGLNRNLLRLILINFALIQLLINSLLLYQLLVYKILGKNAAIDPRSRWPKDRGDYLKFVLYKECNDTIAAIWTISKFLRWLFNKN